MDMKSRSHYGIKSIDHRNDKMVSRNDIYRDENGQDDNEWQMKYEIQNFSRSISPVQHKFSNSSRSSRKRYNSPLDKSRSTKSYRHSRSRSPRNNYNSSSNYISPSGNDSRGLNSTRSRSKSKSPSVSMRRIDFKEKISDTSLFAELVKDRHKRDRALKEILENKKESDQPDSVSSSANQSILTNDDSNFSNGFNNNNNVNTSIDILNIPIPETTETELTIDKTVMESINNKPLSETEISNTVDSSKILDKTQDKTQDKIQDINSAINNKPEEPKVQNTNSQPDIIVDDKRIKPKSKNLIKLPMPPGINPADLDDIKSPTPPDSISPVLVKSNTTTKISEISKKKGLLDLPMPCHVGGFEELSGDEDAISPKYIKNVNNSTTPKKRPKILHRKFSMNFNPNRDWGERCVDVFEVIAQIGEGTYGQVNKFYIY